MDANHWTSFERVQSALRHKEPDKVPLDLGGTAVTGINIHLYRKLREWLGLPQKDVVISDINQQLAKIDPDVADALKIDVVGLQPGTPEKNSYLKAVEKDGKYYKRTDEWGIEWKMPVENGHYFDMVGHPLANCKTVEDLKKYDWQDPEDEGLFASLAAQNKKIVFEDKKAPVIASGPGVWELALWINGFEKFFSDMASEKNYAHAVMRKLTDYKKTYWKKALDRLGENVLVAHEADDLATQQGLLISPSMYKELIHPYHKELYQFIHSYAKNEIFIFYHSCGACGPLIPLLIEEGVNILNPVQVSAKGIDPIELKKQYGKDISFWGGGVDTQRTLPFGTPDEVREEVKRRITELAEGGGYVFAAIHNVQSDVPVENFMAMWDTLQEYGVY